jgi:nucleoside-triphosphatase
MHVFLTGEIQIGKSTVIEKTLLLINSRVGGFKTYFGSDRNQEHRLLYLNEAAKPKDYDKNLGIVEFFENGPPIVDTEKFNTFGVELIQSARQNAQIILMDECGNLESQALTFQHAIIETLSDSVPVLGVIKQSSSGWTDVLRNHPHVKLITVTMENRDTLPADLAANYKATILSHY